MSSLDDARARWGELTSFESTGVSITVSVLAAVLTFVLSLVALSVLDDLVPYSSLMGVATALVVFACCYVSLCHAATRLSTE